MTIFHGIRLVGINVDTGIKILLTLALIAVVILLRAVVRSAAQPAIRGWERGQSRFWVRQAVNLGSAVLLVAGLLSIWFNSPTRLATFLGLVSAGIAFALQSVITAFAGYFVILRGNVFRVGDRIVLGGVRGDVISVGLLHTAIMEMGEPPSVQGAPPAAWISSRQYTGRIVTVTNDQIFSNPVYNYSRDFPFIWDQMTIAVEFGADYAQAERIILDAARRHAKQFEELAEEQYATLAKHYDVRRADLQPATYYHLTPNWLEITVRFVARPHGIAPIKDAMTREILAAFTKQHIGIGSYPTQQQILQIPPLRIENGAVGAR